MGVMFYEMPILNVNMQNMIMLSILNFNGTVFGNTFWADISVIVWRDIFLSLAGHFKRRNMFKTSYSEPLMTVNADTVMIKLPFD